MTSNYTVVDYDRHLAFQFPGCEAVAYTAVKGPVERFNTSYLQISKNGSLDKDRAIELLVPTLKEIFSILRDRVSDPMTQRFHEELWQGCERLLLEDIEFHSRNRRRFGGGAESSVALAQLKERAFTTGQIAAAVVDEILEAARADIEVFRVRLEEGKFSREDLSTGNGPAVKRIVSIMNREFRANGVLSALSEWYGFDAHVWGCAIELSSDRTRWWEVNHSAYPRDTKTTYFHYDEAFRNPKSILYLTDVTSESGPTGVVPGTKSDGRITPIMFLIGRIIAHVGSDPKSPLWERYQPRRYHCFSSINRRRDFMTLPSELRFNSHFGFDVIPGSELEENLSTREVEITGAKGTYLVFDGANLLHRGGLVKKGDRLALQIIFAARDPLAKRIAKGIRNRIGKLYEKSNVASGKTS